jgi:hypothetical protein
MTPVLRRAMEIVLKEEAVLQPANGELGNGLLG